MTITRTLSHEKLTPSSKLLPSISGRLTTASFKSAKFELKRGTSRDSRSIEINSKKAERKET